MTLQDDPNSGDPANKTDLWLKSPASPRHPLPETCPTCKSLLQAKYVYVGIFPYIHTGINLRCIVHPEHEFTFCFAYNPAMTAGYTFFDTTGTHFYKTDKTCPFHPDTHLEPFRLYGNLVFKDGTQKMQLRCPICSYSLRVTFKKS
jgi:hypothetical protein